MCDSLHNSRDLLAQKVLNIKWRPSLTILQTFLWTQISAILMMAFYLVLNKVLFIKGKQCMLFWQCLWSSIEWMVMKLLFLAHLSQSDTVSFCDTMLSVVCVCVCVYFFIQTSSSLKPLIGFLPNFTGMIPGDPIPRLFKTFDWLHKLRSWG